MSKLKRILGIIIVVAMTILIFSFAMIYAIFIADYRNEIIVICTLLIIAGMGIKCLVRNREGKNTITMTTDAFLELLRSCSPTSNTTKGDESEYGND